MERKMSRRESLAVLGLLAASSQVAFGATPAKEKVEPKIALQLYTVRDAAKEDLAGTLKKVREMGWEYVQWSGMEASLSAGKIREELDKAGLKAIAAHTGIEGFENDFEGQVKFWKTVGVTAVGPGGIGMETLEVLQKNCKRLDAVGAKLREVGMKLTYHNHSHEFEKFESDPRTKEDILLESTTPGNVFAEFDVAWVLAANQDPAAYLRKYKGRSYTMHAKDYAKNPKNGDNHLVALGTGDVNWPDVFAAAREAGVEWVVYEQDTCSEGVFEAAKISYDFLKKNFPK